MNCFGWLLLPLLLGLTACVHGGGAAFSQKNPCIAAALPETPDGLPLNTASFRIADVARSTEDCSLEAMSLVIVDRGLPGALTGHRDAAQGDQAQIIKIAKRLRSRVEENPDRPLKILIFAHGGLVSQKSAEEQAAALAPYMLADGYEPIFLIWNSDGLPAYANRLCCVRDGMEDRSNPLAGAGFSSLRLFGDLVSGIGRAPENYAKQIIRFNESTVSVNTCLYDLHHDQAAVGTDCRRSAAEEARPATLPVEDNDFCSYFPDSAGLNRQAEACPVVVFPPFDTSRDLNAYQRNLQKEAGFVATFPVRIAATPLTGPGEQTWHNLVRRTRLAFDVSAAESAFARHQAKGPTDKTSALASRLEEFAGPPEACGLLSPTGEREPKSDGGGFARLFECLNVAIAEGYFGSTPVEIHLYGHSMGGIIVNEAVRYFPSLPYNRIVHMASAATLRDFSQASLVLARSDPTGSLPAFFNLSLHPLNESRELFMGGIVPAGTLLEWIDEYFEGPRTIDDRTLGKWTNISAASRHLDREVRAGMVARVFPKHYLSSPEPDLVRSCAGTDAAGFTRCHPTHHGEFDDFSFWRSTFLCDLPERNPACWALLD